MFAKAVFIIVVCSAVFVTSYRSSKVDNVGKVGKMSKLGVEVNASQFFHGMGNKTQPKVDNRVYVSPGFCFHNAFSSTVINFNSVGDYTRFQTPFYPIFYPNNIKYCEWNFKGPPGTQLYLICPLIDIRSGDSMLIDIGTVTYSVSGTYNYGYYLFPSNIGSLGLRTDSSNFGRGFDCQVSVKASPSPPTTITPPTTTAPTTTAPTTTAPTTIAPTTTMPPSGNCACGKKAVSRIVGGQETGANEYPWMAALSIPGHFPFCGATLISSSTVVTAAHCVTGNNSYEVLLGQHSIITDDNITSKHQIVKVLSHPDYNSVTYDNDIALIRFTPPIDFTSQSTVLPACLPDDLTETYAGANATVTGWGTLTFGGSRPNNLHEVVVPVISNADCESAYDFLTSNMLCAGFTDGEKDSCQGDSGGPLVAADGSNYELIGVVSFGFECAKPNFPGVYARVTEYVGWIKEFITNDEVCPRS